MGALSRSALAAAVLLALGCGTRLPPAPTLSAVQPASVSNRQDSTLAILGSGFQARVRANLDAPGKSSVDATFGAALEAPGARVALTGVTWVSPSALSATLPAGAPFGTYRLTVTDPWGRASSVDGALTVFVDCPNGCPPAGPCFGPGRCLIDGGCAALPLDAGVPCDDGDNCTIGDQCDGQGQCHGKPVSCPATTCRPFTGCLADGECVFQTLDAGTPCDDGNNCTLRDHCDGTGQCVGTAVSCGAGPCETPTGACDADGGCLFLAADAGSACDDGYACTANDVCDPAGHCGGTPVCADTAPVACFTVTPQAGLLGTVVTFDPACSWDLETPSAQLQVSFDFEGNGSFTPLSANQPWTHVYPDAGRYTAIVGVVDDAGLWDYATRTVVVTTPSNDVLVTTPFDENDPGATPAAPGGTGLSLREAINYVNRVGQALTIHFDGGIQAVAAQLPALNAAGASLVGGGGAVVDFALATGGPCLTFNGTGQTVVDLAALDCPGQLALVSANTVQVTECSLSAGPRDAGTQGAYFSQDTGGTFGPGNDVSGFTVAGVTLHKSTNDVVVGNRIHGNATGLYLDGPSLFVAKNLIYANTQSGIVGHGGVPGPLIAFNTLDHNAPYDLDTRPASGGTAIDNLFSNGASGAVCNNSTPPFVVLDPNGYWPASPLLCTGSPGPSSVIADPLYLAPGLGDYRLQPTSPAINAGADAGVDGGLDVNGPASGWWNGSAPDLGACESPF